MSSQKQIPLVVDLDGTLIRTDLLWEHLARYLQRNPLGLFAVLFWWMRGRAFLKQRLARKVTVDPATLPYNEPFLDWLRGEKSRGRRIILATASDRGMVMPVADHVGIFDDVMASDGRTNLRSHNKLNALVKKFGERGFDYAGNSSPDLAVWAGSHIAIVVNASRALAERAKRCATVDQTFLAGYRPFFIATRFCAELFWHSGYLAAIVAGLALAAAFPKTGITGAAWIAPALFVAAAHGKKGAAAFRIGYIGGSAFWLATLYWLLLMPAPGFSFLGWIALCAYLALYPAAWLAIVQRAVPSGESSWSARTSWAMTAAAAWVTLEMVRGWLFGGFPWSFLGGSQVEMLPLAQIAAVTGVYSISFVVVWASLSLFSAVKMIVQKPASRFAWQSEIFLPFLAVVALFVFGEIRLLPHGPPATTLNIAMIQPGVPQTLIWDENANSNRFEELLRMSEAAVTPETEVLVWPESAVPQLDDAAYSAITNLVRRHHLWLIFNAEDVLPKPNARDLQDNDVFNAAFLFDPDGRIAAVYHKQALVIFGEYIPLEHSLPFIKYLTPVTGSFAAGTEPVPFPMHVTGLMSTDGNAGPDRSLTVSLGKRVVAAPLICFEDTFPSLARRAARDDTDFLVNLTNDGWFGDSAEQWQHEANAIFRAIENGIPLVRSANNGISCWIDPCGRVRKIFYDKTGSAYGTGTMTIGLPIQPHSSTFYNRHGDWFGWGCIVFTVIMSAGRIGVRKSSERSSNP